MVELFPKNLANLGPRFGPLFDDFPFVKQLKYPQFVSHASRAGLSYFQKFPNSQIHGRVISEILPILEIHGNVEGGFNLNTVVVPFTRAARPQRVIIQYY